MPAATRPSRRRRATAPPIHAACALVAAIGALAAFATLLASPSTETILLPLLGMRLALDPLTAFFLLALFLPACACAVYALALPARDAALSAILFPALLAALTLALLAGDGWTLVFATALAAPPIWVFALASPEETERAGAGAALGMALLTAAALAAAFALLAPGADWSFATIRSLPPQNGRAAAALALALLGIASGARLAPLHRALSLAQAGLPAHAAALLCGSATKLSVYIFIRIAFDLAGPTPPVWLGLALLALGAASAMLGALRATQAADTSDVLAASTTAAGGFIAIGLGLALLARGADLAPLAALALGVSLLLVFTHAAAATLLLLAAGAVRESAGSRAFARLGGLIQRMPVTTSCALAGAATLAALPPTAGFAALWLLFQAVFAAPRIGGAGLQLVLAGVATSMALAAALNAAAALRLIGIAFLGRPRTPRASAAEEAPAPARRAMLGLAALTVLAGLLPGPILMLADPALRRLAGASVLPRAGLFSISAPGGAAAYSAPAIAVLLAVLGAGLWSLYRHHHPPAGARAVPPWDGGFDAPPAWLPYGDPATQMTAAGFSDMLRPELDLPMPGVRAGLARLAAWLSRDDPPATPSPRRALLVALVASLVLLALLAWAEAA